MSGILTSLEDIQARRQDSATGGPKARRGATFLKYCIGCMQQPGGKT